MYKYDFLCTYQELEDENEKDLCYKLQFLQAFLVKKMKTNLMIKLLQI